MMEYVRDFLGFLADMTDLRMASDGKKKTVRVVVALIIALLALAASLRPADAAVRYTRRIEEVPGLRFENFVYAWDKVELDVVNTTSSNRAFEGTMIFLDRRGKPLARASLLPKKIPAGRSERYVARFVDGSGESARGAARIIWDLGAMR